MRATLSSSPPPPPFSCPRRARARSPGREEGEEDVARRGEMAAENKPEDEHGHLKIYLPKKLLECLPKCSSLPKERHRWNTNEVLEKVERVSGDPPQSRLDSGSSLTLLVMDSSKLVPCCLPWIPKAPCDRTPAFIVILAVEHPSLDSPRHKRREPGGPESRRVNNGYPPVRNKHR
ncbi:calmodulin-binding transcription activator 1-like isoform X6 [Arapaima gigas]